MDRARGCQQGRAAATRHDGRIKRRGRAAESYLSEDQAVALIPDLIAEHRAEMARAQDERVREAEREVTFDEIATAWLQHRVAVVGIKRTTHNDYETMLLRPDDQPKKRGRAPRARIMSAFGGRPAASITTREVSLWLNELDHDPELSARSVNKHRTVLHGMDVRLRVSSGVLGPAVGSERRSDA